MAAGGKRALQCAARAWSVLAHDAGTSAPGRLARSTPTFGIARHLSTLPPATPQSTSPPPDGSPSPSSQASVEELFCSNPKVAAEQLVGKLSPAQRAILASALAQHSEVNHLDEKYWEELFRAHDREGDSALNKSEFQAAMLAHTRLTENQNRANPGRAALWIVFLASAIPFLGFGFLDNAIMLVAGEEIDNLLGVKFGLSTLASAGLGNAVADVIGVGAAKYIEQAVRWLPFVKEPRLSKHQNALPVTQRAKLSGAMLGVLCGCLLGLTPLFLSGSFFTPR